MGGVFFCLRSRFFSKEKKKKKKALYKGLDKWMQAFRLKNFQSTIISPKTRQQEKF
jgi:hypothetical protein